jgi:hypothetical protein
MRLPHWLPYLSAHSRPHPFKNKKNSLRTRPPRHGLIHHSIGPPRPTPLRVRVARLPHSALHHAARLHYGTRAVAAASAARLATEQVLAKG